MHKQLVLIKCQNLRFDYIFICRAVFLAWALLMIGFSYYKVDVNFEQSAHRVYAEYVKFSTGPVLRRN